MQNILKSHIIRCDIFFWKLSGVTFSSENSKNYAKYSEITHVWDDDFACDLKYFCLLIWGFVHPQSSGSAAQAYNAGSDVDWRGDRHPWSFSVLWTTQSNAFYGLFCNSLISQIALINGEGNKFYCTFDGPLEVYVSLILLLMNLNEDKWERFIYFWHKIH